MRANRYARANGAVAMTVAMTARRSFGTPTEDGTNPRLSSTIATGPRARPPIRRGLHSRRGETRTVRRPRHRAGRDTFPDQSGLASSRPTAPPGPDRRRSRGVADRHAPDGRDQRGLRGPDARPIEKRPGREVAC